jgi:hypothetical protein
MKPATLGTAHSSDNAQRGIYCVPENPSIWSIAPVRNSEMATD